MKNQNRRVFPLAFLVAAFGLALAVPAVGLGGAPAATTAPTPASTSGAGSATERNITRLTANLLEHSQFAHHPLDREFAGTFLDRYLDALDGTRSLFLQSDIDGFAPLRATLAQATRDQGDTSAAHTIFARYLERLEQSVAYATTLLRAGKFDFTGHDSYSYDRAHAQRPRDLAAARELWRQQTRAEYLQEKLTDKPPAKIVSTLMRRHEQQLHTMKTLRGDELLEVYLNALAHVYDPHSDYLGHEQMESLSIAMNLSLFGIGASLQTEDGYVKIHELLPGGPAARSGLFKPGDRIIAVAQAGHDPVDIINMPLSRAVELIRGPKGTVVKLTTIPAGANEGSLPKVTSLVRDEIKLEDQEAKARIVDLPVTPAAPPGKPATIRLGVIDLPSFYADMGEDQRSVHHSATADVATLLKRLKAEHVRGVVLDLRRNGGGSLEEAISMTGLFIRKGPVVQTRDPAGKVDIDADSDPTELYDGPLICLTSRFSASASEILAGALQDYGRAVLVGDPSTFGKGTVQNVLPLARVMDQTGLAHAYDPGALKVTIRKFYRPDGASTQLRGVASDLVLPSASDFSDVSESALDDPLPWDSVPASTHDRFNLVQPYLAALRKDSAQRIASDKGFADLGADVARLKKNLATKSVSLNEAERRQEVAQGKARQSQREQEKRAHRASMPTTYEITIENAAAPHLPAPMAITEPKTPPTSPSTPDDLDDDGPTNRSPADDLLLNETMRILESYVGQLSHRPAGT
ncbi:MAG TPA: carboxy terminal-processing peptidase [Polyangia bacterium]|jgi:carboxyl-terminal processing protease